MTIPAGLAAELGLLTQVLDLAETDVADTLSRLAADAQTAVESYLGLSVAITANGSHFDLTVLGEGTQPDDIRTSLLIPLSTADVGAGPTPASVGLILYAAVPGAFTDLAADLSWITGRTLADFRLDEHHALPTNYTDPTLLAGLSNVNQALGVLIGRGATPVQAGRELSERAIAAGTDLLAVAMLILAALTPLVPEAQTEPERP